ncbi:MAG TPA: hypothetical protein VGS21_00190 [Acidimicrobiales bacterium]|nr:hypothetical protein [Acidimicrobiales bacterium]
MIAVQGLTNPDHFRRHHHWSGAIRSEWTKVLCLRSARWTAVAFVVVTVGLGLAVSSEQAAHIAHESAAERADFDPTNWSLSVLGFTQLGIGVLGALVMGSECPGSPLSSSLDTVQDRLRLIAAKAVVVAGLALTLGEAVTFTTFFSGQALLRHDHAPSVTIGHGGVLAGVVWSGVFLCLLGLLGLGLGAILRESIRAVWAYAFVMFPLTTLLSAYHLGKYAPEMTLVNSVSAVRSNAANGFLPPGSESVALMALYTAICLAAGAALFACREAERPEA